MASKRKNAKLRKMEVKKVLKKLDKYTKNYTFSYGNGYYLFPFGLGNFNLHIKFNKLPLIKFAIWKWNQWYYFAECIPYIDKFKPGRCEFEWSSFDSMVETVMSWINNYDKYVSDLEKAYCSNSPYFPLNYQEILDDYKKSDYERSHNYFSVEEYQICVKKFNELVKSLDTNKLDFFWHKSNGYKKLYDVRYFPGDDMSDEEIDELESKLRDCKCFSFQWRPLPPYFYKHKHEYKYKIHPGNYELYFNQKKHLKYFAQKK